MIRHGLHALLTDTQHIRVHTCCHYCCCHCCHHCYCCCWVTMKFISSFISLPLVLTFIFSLLPYSLSIFIDPIATHSCFNWNSFNTHRKNMFTLVCKAVFSELWCLMGHCSILFFTMSSNTFRCVVNGKSRLHGQNVEEFTCLLFFPLVKLF